MEDANPFTKSKTIDPEVRAYVYSLVNALGGTGTNESGRYVLGDDALAVLRDLKRWLKLYDEKTNRLDVARCLAEANLVRGDLLPILSTWKENGKNEKAKTRTALACLELLVPLTWPVEHEEMTANHHRHTPYILQSQVKYKAAVLHWEATAVLRQTIRIALPALAMKRDERTPRDEGIIKLMLYLIRNIAAIRQVPNLPSQGLDTEVSRSATIETFRAQDVFALLLTICSNMGEDYNLMDVIVLEIIFNLIKGVNAEQLWMNQQQRTKTGISDLRATLAAEQHMHMEAKKKEGSRHGRFGTMIWVKGDDKQMKTVSGQDNLKNHKTAMFNMDNNKKWNKPMQRRKDLDHTNYDFDQKETLSSEASEQLRNFAEEFLDSGFNPLVSHLRKAIEREAERLLPINYRQFFYIVAWFLKAERVRRERKHKDAKASKAVTEFDPESYGLVAAVLNQETFITLNRYMQMSWDEKAWQDLNACMRCFTEILLTVQDMAQSALEEDQAIAENIQNRIFYEETTHDRIRMILQDYKDQGLGYLDACTELSHVFLKMLERYSKENVDLQIRSKRKARRKRNDAQLKEQSADQQNDEQGADDDSEHEDIMDTVQVSKERKFDFKRFAAKFVTQSSVDTFISLLKFYKDLSAEQLKRVHRFLHRAAFKQEQATLLYRVDIVALLYKIVEGPEGLSNKHALYGEWQEFTKQLFRKMFKKVDQRPELIVEMLFSKITNTLYYLEYGHDKQTSTSTRPPAELEVKASAARDRKEQIGVAVTVLLRDHKDSLVDWVKRIVNRAYDERFAWEAEGEARKAEAEAAAVPAENDEGNQKEPVLDLPTAQPSYISISPENDEIRIAMFKNARLKLLMRLVGLTEENNDKSGTPDAMWIIPSHVVAAHLEGSKAAIEQYSATQWQPENEDDNPEDFLRRVGKDQRASHYAEEAVGEDGEPKRDNFIDDSEGDEILPEEEGFLFPDNPRQRKSVLEQLKAKRAAKSKKRKRGSDDEEPDDSEDGAMKEQRRRKREEVALARRRKFKSEAFIRDSDDESDDERDRAFFEREAELRKKYAQLNRAQIAAAAAAGAEEVDEASLAKRRKTVARLRGEIEAGNGDEDVVMGDDQEDSGENSAPPSSQPRRNGRSSEAESDEETPPSSPPPDDGDGKKPRQALKELPQGKAQPRTRVVGRLSGKQKAVGVELDVDSDSDLELEDEDQDEVIHAKAITTQRSRGGFVIDDDDDE
ncbi:Topoisomerase 1-associated factor 1 [Exophiala xenobiotica]|uniref:Topoisomerase 1-associated factor 1 n=1 Tax=Lithohypha guttulata TaxID=1690604 RepID=A0ABR0KM82_9EURO|nr:Topoisomerase 1-associated factor 1 [Lithohypha guttulata]KAK5329056.1 Topoisomerase 1-associated factor 1 [Exophiala xenobiotica]